MIERLCNLLWGVPLLTLIVGTGLYLTIRLRGMQFRYLLHALRLVVRPHSETAKGDIPPTQALMTTLAGTIGIGSIAGVATAVVTGGLGALVWMVVAAVLGLATIYSEAFLAVRFRKETKTGMAGGPMYYIRDGLGWRWLASLFAGGGIVATMTTGNMVQANAIAEILGGQLPYGRWIVGIVLALMSGIVLMGGIRKIGRVTMVLVPVMAGLYLMAGLVVIILRIDQVPHAVMLILSSAFNPTAAFGGLAGGGVFLAIRMGVARGILASEASLGSAPIAAAAAKTDTPGRQALLAMVGAFISVCVVCTITGLVLAVSGVIGMVDSNGKVVSGVLLTANAFDAVLPYGRYVVSVGAVLFGYSTVLGWAYYGERCSEYLFGAKAVTGYRLIYILAIVAGAVMELDLVWNLADLSNIFMIVPNLIALLGLAGLVARETRPFLQKGLINSLGQS